MNNIISSKLNGHHPISHIFLITHFTLLLPKKFRSSRGLGREENEFWEYYFMIRRLTFWTSPGKRIWEPASIQVLVARWKMSSVNAVMGLYVYVTGQMGRNNQNKGGKANLFATEIPWLFYFKNESSLLLGSLHLPEVDNNY